MFIIPTVMGLERLVPAIQADRMRDHRRPELQSRRWREHLVQIQVVSAQEQPIPIFLEDRSRNGIETERHGVS